MIDFNAPMGEKLTGAQELEHSSFKIDISCSADALLYPSTVTQYLLSLRCKNMNLVSFFHHKTYRKR